MAPLAVFAPEALPVHWPKTFIPTTTLFPAVLRNYHKDDASGKFIAWALPVQYSTGRLDARHGLPRAGGVHARGPSQEHPDRTTRALTDKTYMH